MHKHKQIRTDNSEFTVTNLRLDHNALDEMDFPVEQSSNTLDSAILEMGGDKPKWQARM